LPGRKGPVGTSSAPCQPLSAALSPREFEIGVLRCSAGHSPVSSGPPGRVRTGRESGQAGKVSATARSSGLKRRRVRGATSGGGVKRRHGDVLLSRRNGSPEDTDLERVSLAGPRNKGLRD
jgi:hypothetical protein